MSRPVYAPKHTYLGDGSNAEYDFDFKITSLDHLLIIKVDDDNEEVFRVRGDDVVYLADVTFDEITDEGGTVTLADNLESGYSLIILLADDEPVQSFEFREKGEFVLRNIERALDAVAGAIQRVAYLAQRSAKLHDLDDEDAIDMTLPAGFADQAGRALVVNEDGDGLTYQDMPAAGLGEGDAFAEQFGPFTITDGQAATNLTDVTVDGATRTSAIYFYEIWRGTTVFSTGIVSLHYRDNTWYVVEWSENHDSGGADHGCTFSVSQTGDDAQLRLAADSGAGDGQLKLRKTYFESNP